MCRPSNLNSTIPVGSFRFEFIVVSTSLGDCVGRRGYIVRSFWSDCCSAASGSVAHQRVITPAALRRAGAAEVQCQNNTVASLPPVTPVLPSRPTAWQVSGPSARYCRSSFFFQAEDGIRDLTVTGVQTCALPI